VDQASFETRLSAVAEAVEARLAGALAATPLAGEIARPERLLAAMRHAVLGGGKRLRPALLVETARMLGREPDGAVLAVAAALECVHCYSLVHDDLPSMDDDAVRRGRPTVHVAFDEATAILAGDALLTLAFDLAAETGDMAVVRGLARAAGLGGMAGGQILDLAAEGRFGDGGALDLAEADIRRLQAMKTGALIRYACDAGALLGGADEDARDRLRRFGEIVGLAFQLADDLLDAEGDSTLAGKATGKDAARGKGTLVRLHGATAVRGMLAGLVADAEGLLAPFGEGAATLAAAARFIAARGR
jgi:farnesyl diphosphate synthase